MISNVTSPPYLFSHQWMNVGTRSLPSGARGRGMNKSVRTLQTGGWVIFRFHPCILHLPPAPVSSSTFQHDLYYGPSPQLPFHHLDSWLPWSLTGQSALTGAACMMVGVWMCNDTGCGREPRAGVRRGYTFPQQLFISSRIRDGPTINHKMTAALSSQPQHLLSDCLVFI